MSNNPYNKMLLLLRGQGAAYNAPSIELGSVGTADPLTVYVGGTMLTDGFWRLDGAAFEAGDVIAVQRIGEINLILGKAVEQ